MRHIPTSPRSTSRCRAALVGMILAAGLAAPSAGQTRSWTDDHIGLWTVPSNWSPMGAPNSGEIALIGNLLQAKHAVAHLDSDVWVAGLEVTDGCRLLNMGHQLLVSGNTRVAGEYNLNGYMQEARVYVEDAPEAIDFQTGNLTIEDKGWFFLEQGATARINGSMLVGEGAYAVGGGRYNLMANGSPALVNHGYLYVHGGDLTVNQLGSGLIDLDGNGSGTVFINPVSPANLTISGTALADTFSGQMLLKGPTSVLMNIADGWEADAQSQIIAQGSIAPGQRLITGSDVVLGGHLETRWGDTVLDFAADTVIRDTVTGFVGAGTRLHFSGDTRVEGGAFEVEDGGYLFFEGATEWDGDAVIAGTAHQLGSAAVVGPTLISAGVFNLDGGGSTSWQVNASLVLRTDSIDDHAWERFDGTVTVAGGFLPALTIQYNDPDLRWVMNGTMNLSGDSSLYSTKVGGAGFFLLGALNVTSGKVAIASETVNFWHTSTTTFGASGAALRMHGETTVQRGAEFSGSGTLRIAPNGDLILEDGADLNQVALHNDGVLVIGDEAPGAAWASALTLGGSSLWHVEIGGYTAREEFDQMVVDGSVTLGGDLFVDLVDLGGGSFLPQLGDRFNILSVGGTIGGSFSGEAYSLAGGNMYRWEAVVGPHRVDLEVVEVNECVADFNEDGVVNTLDFLAFLNAWAGGDHAADINRDGTIDTRDVLDFLNLWVAGC